MPKILEYFGLIIFFYSNEHEPVHVHGKYQDKESKAEIIIVNGKVKEIIYSNVKGKEPLTSVKYMDFCKLVEKYSEMIVEKWVDYFVLNKAIKSKKITRKIK